MARGKSLRLRLFGLLRCKVVFGLFLGIPLAAGFLSCADGLETVSTPSVTHLTGAPLPAPADASDDALWGFVDENGNWVIKPQFQDASRFREGLAAVEVDGKWGYLDEEGTLVIRPQYNEAHGFDDGLARVATGPAADPNDHWLVTASAYGFIDKTGSMVIPAEWDDAGDFREGLAPVMRGSWCGFIDAEGTLVIPLEFDSVVSFSEGLACALSDGKWGYLDKSGDWAIEPQYRGMTWTGVPDEAFMLGVGRFKNGLAPVLVDGPGSEWCYIDKTGKRAFQEAFGFAGEFNEGLAPVQVDVFWGFVDTSGALAIGPQFEPGPDLYVRRHGGFHEGLAAAALNGKVGYIDRTGKFAIQPQFAQGYDFVEGYAYVYTWPPSTVPESGDATSLQVGPLAIIDVTGRVIYQAPPVRPGSAGSS